jgi:hypothetical protein
MKSYLRKLLISAFALTLAFGLYSCTEQNSVNDSTPTIDDVQEYAIMEFDAGPASISEPSLDEEFTLHPAESAEGMEQRPDFIRPVKVIPLFRILISLDLNDSQRVQARRLLHAHHDCIRAIMMRVHQSEIGILRKANQKRDSILTAFRNGDITATEAREQLRNLHRRVRHALHENPVRRAAMEAMKDCWDTFFRRLHSILDEEQQAKLERWLNHLRQMHERRRPNRGNE